MLYVFEVFLVINTHTHRTDTHTHRHTQTLSLSLWLPCVLDRLKKDFGSWKECEFFVIIWCIDNTCGGFVFSLWKLNISTLPPCDLPYSHPNVLSTQNWDHKALWRGHCIILYLTIILCCIAQPEKKLQFLLFQLLKYILRKVSVCALFLHLIVVCVNLMISCVMPERKEKLKWTHCTLSPRLYIVVDGRNPAVEQMLTHHCLGNISQLNLICINGFS